MFRDYCVSQTPVAQRYAIARLIYVVDIKAIWHHGQKWQRLMEVVPLSNRKLDSKLLAARTEHWRQQKRRISDQV